MAGIYLKFTLCFVLLVSLECRVIKIIDDEDSNNDIVVKIILKNKKREHSKVKKDEDTKLKEVLDETDKEKAEAKLREIIEEMKNEMHKKSDKNEGHEEDTNVLSGDNNFELSKKELPDNFKESEDEPRDSISDNLIDKETPQLTSEFVPKLNSRSGIQVGSCPSGFIRRGPLCLPADK